MVGDSLTLADFSLIPSVTTLGLMVPIEADKYPKLTAWIGTAKETFLQYEQINEEAHKTMKSFLHL